VRLRLLDAAALEELAAHAAAVLLGRLEDGDGVVGQEVLYDEDAALVLGGGRV
jgi:hypothetical protein